MRTSILAAAAVACTLSLGRLAHAQDCGRRSPATPPPQMLWPAALRPADTGRAGRQLPDQRDSTDYITQTIPGAQSGHELFESVATLGGWLFVAYNAGIQVWQPQARDPDALARVAFRDGWQGHWLEFPRPGEADSFVTDLAVAPLAGDQIAVAIAANSQVGVAIWRFDPAARQLVQAYQSPTETATSIAAARYGDRTYVFAAIANRLQVFDATAAVAGAPCVEDIREPSCPGVYLGALGGVDRAAFVAARTFEGPERPHLMVAATDAALDGSAVQLLEVNNPLRPALAENGGSVRVRFEGIADMANGMALFEARGHAWLAVLDHLGGAGRPGNQLVVHAIDGCLGAACALGAPAWASPHFPSRAARKTLRHSVDDRGTADPGDDEHFLYMGFVQGGQRGASAERLYHLADLRPAGPNPGVVEVTADGATYADGCSGEDVGYWGWYHPTNDHGLRGITPRSGVFLNDRFYRAARSVFDVHVWTRPEPPPVEADMGPAPVDMGPRVDRGVPADLGVSLDFGALPDAGADDAAVMVDLGPPDAGEATDQGADERAPVPDAQGDQAIDVGAARADAGSGAEGCAARPGSPRAAWLALLALAALGRRRVRRS